MDLKNKIVVITGSSSGIGRATALRFAQEGAKIVVNYNVNKVGGKETLLAVNKISEGILIQADVTDKDNIKSFFKKIIKKYGTVDVLINNAAIATDKEPFLDSSTDLIEEMVMADLVGPMLCSREAYKIMQDKGCGKIINTSSIRGAEHGGRPGGIVYGASKAGLISFSKTLSKMSPNIQVNAVAPGFVKTRNYDKASPELINTFLDQTYLKRWITENEVADAFIFLAKNDAMTGQVVYVDGGFTLK